MIYNEFMKDKKNITIFEVICILLITTFLSLIIIPNIINIISKNEDDVFIMGITECYNAAINNNVSNRTIYKDNENPLNIFAKLRYYVVLDADNKIVTFKATNDVYYVDITNNDGIKLLDIQNNIVKLDDYEIFALEETNKEELYLKTYENNLHIYLLNLNEFKTVTYEIYDISEGKNKIDTIYSDNMNNNYYLKYALDKNYKGKTILVEAYTDDKLLLAKEIKY